MKVSHSTRTANLQLVDPACSAVDPACLPLRNTLRPEFGIFIFCQFFSAKLRLGRISAVVTGRGIREILFFSFGNSFNEINIRAHRYPCDHTRRAT